MHFSKIISLYLCLVATKSTADIQVAVSLTWEGDSLKKTNLESIDTMRTQFPNLPFIHFLSPDYYSSTNEFSDSETTKRIRSVVHSQDSIGLHAHGSEYLTRLAGIQPLKGPTFWGECQSNCSREVPLDAWSSKEIAALIQTSHSKLAEHGLQPGPWFLAPGWLATPKVLSAARSQGFLYDFSAIPPSLLQSGLAHFPLLSWIEQLWHSQTVFSQPRQLPTQHGWIKEMGQNLGSMDYQTMGQVLKAFGGYAELQKVSSNKNYFIHLGLHQETALHTAPKLAATLKHMIRIAKNNNIKLNFYRPKGGTSSFLAEALQSKPTILTRTDRHPPSSRH